jgi:hypothetical protein
VVGFGTTGDTATVVVIELRRVKKLHKQGMGATHRVDLEASEAGTVHAERLSMTDDEALILTGCPRCFAFPTVARGDLKSAAEVWRQTGKMQEIPAHPRRDDST